MFSRTKNKSADDVADDVDSVIETTSSEVEPPPPAGAGAAGNTAQRPSGGFLLESSKPSVISEGFSLVGDITANGVLHVEGSIKGAISTEVVNIGGKGSVNGRIKCMSLQIKGAFEGTADCDELIISGKAKVIGKITYRTLSIQRGAQVQGELTNAR